MAAEAANCRPPRRIPPAAILAAILWTLFCAVAYSNAGAGLIEALCGLAAAGLWMLIWLTRLGLSRWRRREEPLSLSRPALFYWGFEPVALAVAAGLSWSGAFMQARFLASEKALSDYAAAVRAGDIAPQKEGEPARRVGLYRVSETSLFEGGAVRFITSSEGLLDAAGFAHSPGGQPPRQGEDNYLRFRGAWYLWRQSW